MVEINNLSTIQPEKNNHELDYIEKNIFVHPDIPASNQPPLPPWIVNGGPLSIQMLWPTTKYKTLVNPKLVHCWIHRLPRWLINKPATVSLCGLI